MAVNDCLNYVPAQKLKAAFSHVRTCLKKGGAFIFDISSPHKLRNIIGDNLFAEDRDDVSYIWFNSLSGDSVIMDLTFFEKIPTENTPARTSGTFSISTKRKQ